ncbi:zinc-dependent alcohol dehydrogenase family protein [Burkholderia stabilis]|uniref:Alcohol dehydrogenase,putative alcohol dehydrogenase,putative NAD(P)H quinone oxidoreductase, PIG3 family,Zinc-binding dehydrogenase n=1 Tax=Burkholderia stabilis TaxID=95485 RepID=A0AAJ5T2A9_9BURK|nr:NAD(P)-dependent alcohol dehydrogenase [Burkholderia stabilis]VBB10194.1 Alcohol dehydrogenase,putative alcohol dehydrogenase,putative NAD(P)H quinone oxidoreductase, PIG3 family,Zinc-binding dehydrogenase [Burkholderia stabilis]
MSSLMHRWQSPAFSRQHLQLAAVPVPAPGPRDVLVRVDAVALNYRDLLVLRDGMGMAVPFPLVPGSDMRGEVVATGADVADFAPGDAVISTFFTGWQDGIQPRGSVPLGVPGPGMLSEYVVLGADSLVAAPRTLDAAQASTLTCAGLTAWYALADASTTRPGDTVVVIGTGGVALFAVQIAHAQGARVIVVSGSDEKLERAKRLGAHDGINRSRTPDWAAEVRALTGGRGADHVLELAGADNFGRSLSSLVQGGRVSVIGNLGGDALTTSVYPLLTGRATVQGIGVAHRRALEDLVRAVDWLKLKPVIEHEYAFDALPAALDHLERGAFGKVVVRMR